MTGSLRYLLAAAFVAVFFLAPEVDHGHVAFLKTRAWLTSEDSEEAKGPLSKALGENSAMPPLQVDLRQPGSADALLARSGDYSRSAREWARGKELEDDGQLPPILLEVRVGDEGFRSTLKRQRASEWVEVDRLEVLRNPSRESGELITYYPNRFSLLPAFLAIILAILSGKVIPSLLIGCLAGAIIHTGAVFGGAFHLASDNIASKILFDQFRFEILGFVIFLFMCVGVMTRSGGIQGMVEWIRKFARGPVSTQLCSFVIGILIFFDDYSNCIVSGSTMRPLADRNRVSREKLAYIVDSTAAPIAGISIISTWVAYEVSMFAPQLPEVTHADGRPFSEGEGFAVFVQTLPFRYYCLFTLGFVLLSILTRREFGGMFRAEKRAHEEGKPSADDATPMLAEDSVDLAPPADVEHRGRNALLPVLLLVGLTMCLIFYFGMQGTSESDRSGAWWEIGATILGAGESQRALMIASFFALLLAIGLAMGQRILSLGQAIGAALKSAHSLIFAVIILILAWAIGNTCEDLGTAEFLTAAFHGSFEPWLLPMVMFAISSLIAFSTGTSYGTMAILLPNVVVLSHSMGESAPELGGTALMFLTIGAVLEGSIFGDHCSPISDTTVLSSVATSSDHLHHVRTQAPYAVVVMIIAMTCGYLPAVLWGLSYWPITWGMGLLAMLAFLFIFGRNPRRGAVKTDAVLSD